ncbi:MAG: sugar porter family MFS transporter [Megasphaera sp.]|jgi:major inositol transporter-like SP family MFS transporter|nr:sugar porter family MFS transporter [Megasphaera sp.]
MDKSAERLDVAGRKTPKQFLMMVTVISTFGNLLFGYDTGVLNGALPYMALPSQLDLTPVLEGVVTSVLLLGAALGSVTCGKLSDRFGRRKVISNLAVLFFFGALGCTFSPNASFMICFRFLLGLAVGGAAAIVPIYLAEMSPADRRGRMVTQGELMIVTGQLLAFTFNAILGVTLGGSEHVWRYMLSLAVIPAIVLFIGMRRMPESPRWLATKGRFKEAFDVLQKGRTHDKAVEEMQEIQESLMRSAMTKRAGLKDLKKPWVRHIVFLGMFLGAVQQMTGVNSIFYYGTQILERSGFSTEAALVANIANGLISVSVTFLAFWLLKRVGRRKMLMGGQMGIIVVLACIGLASMELDGTSILPYIILCLTVSFLAFQQAAVSPVTWVMMSEIFPNRLRGLGMGIAICFLWCVNFCIGLSFPILMAYIGLSQTFFGFAVINVVALICVKIFAPETKGKTLEEIESHFHDMQGHSMERNEISSQPEA